MQVDKKFALAGEETFLDSTRCSRERLAANPQSIWSSGNHAVLSITLKVSNILGALKGVKTEFFTNLYNRLHNTLWRSVAKKGSIALSV